MTSTVAFVGTASKGISYLSGDSEFIRNRELKRQLHRTEQGGGIMVGILGKNSYRSYCVIHIILMLGPNMIV
jgi:hypothetical protein